MGKQLLMIHIAVLTLFVMTLLSNSTDNWPFNTISDMEKYAANLDEFPMPNLPDWDNPNYTAYYKTITPSFASRVLTSLGIVRPIWTPKMAIDLLKYVVNMRGYSGYNGRFVQKIIPSSETLIIVFGELNGSFHSLVRDVRSLQKQSLIKEDLVIDRPDCYIVFNGNACSRSPYALETLTVLLQFMLKNPDHVIYIRGSQEDMKRWMNYSLRRDLVNRAYMLDRSIIPFENLLNKFFNTLPLALYIIASISDKMIETLRISNYGTELPELDENRFSKFFEQNSSLIGDISPEKSKRGSADVFVRSIIWGEQYFKMRYLPSQGLQISSKEGGVISWVVSSSPNLAYQNLFNFFYDAYVIIKTGKKLDDWTITLFNRHLEDIESIRASTRYKLFSGLEIALINPQKEYENLLQSKALLLEKEIALIDQEIDKMITASVALDERLKVLEERPSFLEQTGMTAEKSGTQTSSLPGKKLNSLYFGTTMDFSRGDKTLSESAKSGIELALSTFKKEELTIQLVSLDDTHDSSKARKNVEKLIKEYQVSVLLSPLGSDRFNSFKDLIQIGAVATLFPMPGVPYKRTPENVLKYCVYYRPSYEDETIVLTKYALDTIHPKKIAVFYQNDLFGYACLAGVRSSIPKDTHIVEVAYERNNANFTKQVDILQNEMPDCIILCASPSSARALLRQLPNTFIINTHFFGVSDLGEANFQKFLKDKNIVCVTTNTVPNPNNVKIPLVAEYNKLCTQSHITPSTPGLETFLTTMLLLNVINSVTEITPDVIIKRLENIKNYDFMGIFLNFNPLTRQLSHVLWLNTGQADWQEVATLAITKEAQAPEEKRTLSIGCTADLTRELSVIAKPVALGVSSLFNALNAQGGINGTLLSLNFKNDEYVPEISRKNIVSFLKENIDIFLLSVGSPTLNSYLDLIKEKKVLVMFPITGAAKFRSKDLPYIIHARASFNQEGHKLAQYALETLGAKKVVLFFQDDVDEVDEIRRYFKKKEFKNFSEVVYARQETDFSKQVNFINKYNPDTIIFLAIPTAALKLIDQIGVPNLVQKKLLGWSDLMSGSFMRDIKQRGLKIIISGVVPNPALSSLPIIKEYRNYAMTQNFSLDCFSLEGFIAGKIFEEIIKHIDGPITKEKIIDVAERFQAFDLGGINLTFNPETRQLINSVWLDIGSDEWLEEKLPVHARILTNAFQPIVAKDKPQRVELKDMQQEEKSYEKRTLSVGCTADVTSNISVLSKPLLRGFEVVVNAINERGGINGTVINFSIKNDKYSPEIARKNVLDFLQDNIDTIIFPIGSSTLCSYLDLIKDKKVLVLFPIKGVACELPKDLNYIFHARAQFNQESQRLAQYAIETLGSKKIVVFCPDREMISDIRDYFKKKEFKNFIEVTYARQIVNFTQQVDTITKFNPDTILFLALPAASLALIRQLGIPYLAEKHLLGWSGMMAESFSKNIHQRGLKMIISNVVPNPQTSELPIVQEYRKYASDNRFSVDTFSLEGFICGKILEVILKKIHGPITKEKIVSVAEQFNNFDLGGITLTFNPETRQLINSLWIDTGLGDWIEEKITIDQNKVSSSNLTSEKEKLVNTAK